MQVVLPINLHTFQTNSCNSHNNTVADCIRTIPLCQYPCGAHFGELNFVHPPLQKVNITLIPIGFEMVWGFLRKVMSCLPKSVLQG